MLVEYVYWRMAAAARGSIRSFQGFSHHQTPLGLRRNSATSPTQLMRIQETSFISSRVYGKSRSPELKAVRPMMRDRLPSMVRSTAAPTEARVMRMRRIKRNVRMCFR